MLHRKTPLKRSTKPIKRSPIRKVRATLRRGEPTTEEKRIARDKCYERAEGRCEIRISPSCLHSMPLDGDLLERAHLCHLKSKRRFGWHESDVQKHILGCAFCHDASHNSGGKPVPKKQ